jgi:long-chain acyl-CoA synthetase
MSYANLAELHRLQAERLGPRPALRFKRHGLFADLSWTDYHAAVRACAAALVEAGIRPGDRVAVLSENRPEWLIADLGILAAGGVNVPPHAPLTGPQVAYQLAATGVRFLFISNRSQRDRLRPHFAELPTLETIVVFDRDPGRTEMNARRPCLVSWTAFLQRGRRALARLAPELARREAALGPDDLATIMYTSGTTADPKGVMLTHGNLLSNALASLEAEPTPGTAVQLGWLPVSHIFARTMDHYRTQAAGVVLALAESAEAVPADLKQVRPTHMNSVPRFYEKVLAACTAPEPAETGRRLRNFFGSRMEHLCSGGAPLSAPVAEAYRDAGLPLTEGYGLTESSPVVAFNRRSRPRIGTVGPALPGVEVRIAADGELLTRGPHVMKGYWNDAAATAAALRDGWLYTGDLARIDDDGFLTITGRKKELLVLSNGKKVVPSQVEARLVADPCIDQAAVAGEGRHFLTALLAPHWDNVRAGLRAEGAAVEGSPEVLRHHPTVTAFLRRRVGQALAELAPWEQVKKFVVLAKPFTVADEELTVSLKLRRNVVLSRHAEAIDRLYRD